MYRITRFVLLSVCAAGLLCAQDEPPAQAPAGGGGGRGGLGAGAATVPDPQPYDRVITKDAKTTKGLFTVHQIKERYYYEIPKSELGKDLLWNSQIAKTTAGAGYGGGQLVDKVVRWELKGRCGIRQRRRSGNRGHADLHRRPAGIQRAAAPGRYRRGCHAHFHRAHQPVPR